MYRYIGFILFSFTKVNWFMAQILEKFFVIFPCETEWSKKMKITTFRGKIR